MDKTQIIDKWLDRISDDYMHFDKGGKNNARLYANACQIVEYEDKGVLMYAIFRDIDYKLKLNVVLFYIKPEYRGTNLFLTMIKNIETIAIKEHAKEIIIGASVSGFKEDSFYKALSRFGYKSAGFIKKV